MNILKIKNKWCVDTEDRCILDNNYTWIEVYPDNSNYAITIMMDDKNIIKEWYFDICKGIGVIDNVPYEDDLYLYLVIVPDGRYHVLDEEELKEALNNNDIDIDLYLYNLAYNKLNYLKNTYLSNINELEKFTKKIVKLI